MEEKTTTTKPGLALPSSPNIQTNKPKQKQNFLPVSFLNVIPTLVGSLSATYSTIICVKRKKLYN